MIAEDIIERYIQYGYKEFQIVKREISTGEEQINIPKPLLTCEVI